jgi:hypothetical protein
MNNNRLISVKFDVIRCPSSKVTTSRGKSSYFCHVPAPEIVQDAVSRGAPPVYGGTEIIPVEPGQGNACEGKESGYTFLNSIPSYFLMVKFKK